MAKIGFSSGSPKSKKVNDIIMDKKMTAINFNNIPDLSLKNNFVFETNNMLNYSRIGI